MIPSFPDLKGEFGEKGGIHQDDHNVTVRQMVGQVDVSTIDYEGDTDDIEEADEPMTVNTTKTEYKDESTVKTDRNTSHKMATRETPDRSESIPLSSRPNIIGNTPVRTPNTAQAQIIGVGTILSSSKGIDPNQVKPHVIQDKEKTKNPRGRTSNLRPENGGCSRTTGGSQHNGDNRSTCRR